MRDEKKLEGLRDAIDRRMEKLEEQIEEHWVEDDDVRWTIKNVEIQQAIADNIEGIMKWERIFCIADDILGDCELGVDESFSLCYYEVKTKSDEEYNSQEAKIIVGTRDIYRDFKKLETRAKKLVRKAKSMRDGLESRKYLLKDLAALIINGNESYTLT